MVDQHANIIKGTPTIKKLEYENINTMIQLKINKNHTNQDTVTNNHIYYDMYIKMLKICSLCYITKTYNIISK